MESTVKSNYPLKDYYKEIYVSYDKVNRLFTFGQDKSWRRKAIDEILAQEPKAILDVCTGTGDLILETAKRTSTNVALHGYDFSPEMLSLAEKKSNGLSNVPAFKQGDVAQMPYQESTFDVAGISFGIRNLIYKNSNAKKHIEEIYRVLKPGGRLVILESSKPSNAVWELLNRIYLLTILPLIGGITSGNFKAYRYLGKSSRDYFTKEQMGDFLHPFGFKRVLAKSLFLGSVMLIVVEKQNNSAAN